MRTVLAACLLSVFATACNQGAPVSNAALESAEPLQPMLTLRVVIDANQMSIADKIRLSGLLMDGLLEQQDALEGKFGGADLGAPRDGSWKFLVIGPCDKAKEILLSVVNRKFSDVDHVSFNNAATFSCEDAGAYDAEPLIVLRDPS